MRNRRKTATGLALVLAAAAGLAPSSAPAAALVEGSIKYHYEGNICGLVPECAAFVLSGPSLQTRLEQPLLSVPSPMCNTDLANEGGGTDGIQASILDVRGLVSQTLDRTSAQSKLQGTHTDLYQPKLHIDYLTDQCDLIEHAQHAFSWSTSTWNAPFSISVPKDTAWMVGYMTKGNGLQTTWTVTFPGAVRAGTMKWDFTTQGNTCRTVPECAVFAGLPVSTPLTCNTELANPHGTQASILNVAGLVSQALDQTPARSQWEAGLRQGPSHRFSIDYLDFACRPIGHVEHAISWSTNFNWSEPALISVPKRTKWMVGYMTEGTVFDIAWRVTF